MRKTIAALFLILFLTACTEDVGAVDLTAANNGETITTGQNQTINLKLDSNATTGYKWKMITDPDPSVVKFVSSRYNSPVGGGVGAGGSEIWQFQTTGRGVTSFKLGYFGPSADRLAAQAYQLTVTVQ